MLVRASFIAMLIAGCGNDVETDEPAVPEDLADPTLFSGMLCEISPEVTEGPCLLACDEAALVDRYVPEGACIAFICPLSDGTSVRVGGCNI